MMTLITGETPGIVYILCFDQVIGNLANTRGMAKHYLGFSTDLSRRLREHLAGQGQPITAAAVERGIGWQVYYRLGTPGLERWLKAHYKNTPHLCPRCTQLRRQRASYGFQPLDQLAMDFAAVEDWPAGFEFPDLKLTKRGWAEFQQERAARAVRFDNGDLGGDIPF